MSKTRLAATRLRIVPQRMSRVRKLLPVPDLPNTPFERSTKRRRLSRIGTSMSRGVPSSKRSSPGAPNTRSKSVSSATNTVEKWVGMVRTGRGPSSAPSIAAPGWRAMPSSAAPSRASMSIGCTCTRPKVIVPASTWRRNGSLSGGGSASTWSFAASSFTSVTRQKKSCFSPRTFTNLPTRMSSTEDRPSSRASRPSASEPRTTMPSRSPCSIRLPYPVLLASPPHCPGLPGSAFPPQCRDYSCRPASGCLTAWQQPLQPRHAWARAARAGGVGGSASGRGAHGPPRPGARRHYRCRRPTTESRSPRPGGPWAQQGAGSPTCRGGSLTGTVEGGRRGAPRRSQSPRSRSTVPSTDRRAALERAPDRDAAARPARPIPWVGLGYLLVVYVVWGSTYLAIRIAVREGAGFPPFSMAAMRVGAAGSLLLLWAAASGRPVRLGRRDALVLAGAGLLLWVGGNGLVVWAEQRAESSYAALLVASAPVWVALLEAALDRRAPTPLLAASLLVGLGGVGLLAAPALAAGSAVDAASVGALVLAAVTWGLGSVLQRRHAVSVPPLVSAGYQLLFGAAGLAAAALLAHEPLPTPTPEAWAAWGYLVLAGSLLGFTSYVQVLHLLPTSLAMTYAYVNPAIAVLLGALILGEAITPAMLGGMALVLAGVAGVFHDRYREALRE